MTPDAECSSSFRAHLITRVHNFYELGRRSSCRVGGVRAGIRRRRGVRKIPGPITASRNRDKARDLHAGPIKIRHKHGAMCVIERPDAAYSYIW